MTGSEPQNVWAEQIFDGWVARVHTEIDESKTRMARLSSDPEYGVTCAWLAIYIAELETALPQWLRSCSESTTLTSKWIIDNRTARNGGSEFIARVRASAQKKAHEAGIDIK